MIQRRARPNSQNAAYLSASFSAEEGDSRKENAESFRVADLAKEFLSRDGESGRVLVMRRDKFLKASVSDMEAQKIAQTFKHQERRRLKTKLRRRLLMSGKRKVQNALLEVEPERELLLRQIHPRHMLIDSRLLPRPATTTGRRTWQ